MYYIIHIFRKLSIPSTQQISTATQQNTIKCGYTFITKNLLKSFYKVFKMCYSIVVNDKEPLKTIIF